MNTPARRLQQLLVVLAALLVLLPLAAPPATAQPSFVQVGAGALPGAGVAAGYVAPSRFYTVEGVAYAHRAPAFDAGGDALVAAGVGGALRIGEALRIVLGTGAGYEVDAGVRFGPGLFFKAEETRADKNQRFRLIFDPFVRVAVPLPRQWALFAEAGAQRPALRAGVWVPLF